MSVRKVVVARQLPLSAAAGLPLFRTSGRERRELRSRNPRPSRLDKCACCCRSMGGMKPKRTRSTSLTDRQAMGIAIREALAGVGQGQSPFGCAVVKGRRLVASAHNTVWQTCDSTAHAEMNAIRKACRKLGTIDLSGCVLYTTCEPCPMCYAAAHWARIPRVVFGARIRDAQVAGFNELVIPASKMRRFSGDEIELEPGFMRSECRQLFRSWIERGGGKAY